MLSFEEWLEQRSQVQGGKPKPWKAKKKQILSFWNQLPAAIPIMPARPIPVNHQGSTYTYDGVRITGGRQFVNSVISRIKDVLNYEAKNTKLDLIYKQQIDKTTGWPLPNSFVFYVQIKDMTGSNPDELSRTPQG